MCDGFGALFLFCGQPKPIEKKSKNKKENAIFKIHHSVRKINQILIYVILVSAFHTTFLALHGKFFFLFSYFFMCLWFEAALKSVSDRIMRA